MKRKTLYNDLQRHTKNENDDTISPSKKSSELK